MSSPKPRQCLVSLEAKGRQFLFFCDSDGYVAYYHLPAGDASAVFKYLGHMTYIDKKGATAPVKSTSKWFGGTVYANSEVRHALSTYSLRPLISLIDSFIFPFLTAESRRLTHAWFTSSDSTSA
jgi:hypothetical protein